MEKSSLTRRKVLFGAIAALPTIALSSAAAASNVANSLAGQRGLAGDWSSSARNAGSVSVLVESLDPNVGLDRNIDLINVHFDEVLSIRHSTKVPSSYYFAVDVNRGWSPRSDGDFTISLYDEVGDYIGHIRTGGGGTAIFTDHKLRFRIGTGAH